MKYALVEASEISVDWYAKAGYLISELQSEEGCAQYTVGIIARLCKLKGNSIFM